MVFKNAEDNVEEFAHDGAADSEVMEFAALEVCDPRPKGFAPTPSDGSRHVKSFTQEGVADFEDAGFAIKGVTGTAFGRSQSGIGPQLPSRWNSFPANSESNLAAVSLAMAGMEQSSWL